MTENPFSTFIDFVQCDDRIRSLKKQIVSSQKESLILLQEKEMLVEQQQHAKSRLHELRREIDKQDRTLKELDLNKTQKTRRLQEAASPKEYFSAQQELETIEQSRQKAEDSLLEGWNKLEQEQTRFEHQEKEIQKKLGEFDQALIRQQTREELLAEQLKNQLQLREVQEQNVRGEWLEKYNMMHKRVENPVVMVENGSCSACFSALSQQDLVHVAKHKLIECKGCYRLLYSV